MAVLDIGQLTRTAEMNSSRILGKREQIKGVIRHGKWEEVVKLLIEIRNEVTALNIALMYSCWSGHLDVVKWLVEHTAADVNYNNDGLTCITYSSMLLRSFGFSEISFGDLLC